MLWFTSVHDNRGASVYCFRLFGRTLSNRRMPSLGSIFCSSSWSTFCLFSPRLSWLLFQTLVYCFCLNQLCSMKTRSLLLSDCCSSPSSLLVQCIPHIWKLCASLSNNRVLFLSFSVSLSCSLFTHCALSTNSRFFLRLTFVFILSIWKKKTNLRFSDAFSTIAGPLSDFCLRQCNRRTEWIHFIRGILRLHLPSRT